MLYVGTKTEKVAVKVLIQNILVSVGPEADPFLGNFSCVSLGS